MAAKKFRRNTQQRQVILDELCLLESHPTASELYERVRKRLPRISLGTVYRNLELLSQVGLVQKMEFAGSETRFDGDTGHHYHVRCTRCGKIGDVHDLPADPVDRKIADLAGFEILGHRLEFIGLCPRCRREQPARARQISQAGGE